MRRLKNNLGFTLIETVIYVAIVGLVATSLVAFALSVRSAGSKSISVAEVNSNARFALDIMERSIREADGVVLPAKGDSGAVLQLDMPGTTDNRVFAVSGNSLQLTDGAGTPVDLTSSQVVVTSITFTNNSQGNRRDSIKIQMSLDYNSSAGSEFYYSQTYETSVTKRK